MEEFKRGEEVEIKGTTYIIDGVAVLRGDDYYTLALRRPRGRKIYFVAAYDRERFGKVRS